MSIKRFSVHKFRQEVQGTIPDHNGPYPDYDECMDGASAWRAFIGLPFEFGNANSVDYSADCDKILNTPEDVPLPGDLVVWTSYPANGRYGHIAIALYGCTIRKLRVLSVNWPDGAPYKVVVTPGPEYPFPSYEGVAYWWHPRILGPMGAAG